MKKTFLNIFVATILSITLTSYDVNAQSTPTRYVDEDKILIDRTEFINRTENHSPKYETRAFLRYTYFKKNVRTYEEWSGYRRISSNLKTGPKGGSISSNKTTTFTASATGPINKINVTLGGSVASTLGYTLHVNPNTSAYMGFRVRYRVETGVVETYDTYSKKVIKRENYTIKRPMFGEYALIRY